MEQDGTVPAPRRAPRSRRPTDPAAATPVPAEPRVADLSALLADIDALRTTLSTDLSLAAAALESGADGLAAELVDGDLEQVRAFEARALRHLASLDVAGAPAPPAPEADPVLVPLRRRSRLLAAAPLLAAAAAAAALFAGLVPTSTPLPGPSPTADELSQAGFSLATLSELAEQGASTDEVRDAAAELNDELAGLVADADPLAARQALLLLQASTQVLSSQDDQGALTGVLARTRELERALRTLLPLPAVTLPAVPPLPVPLEAVVRPSPAGSRPPSPARTSEASPTPARPAPASPRPSSAPPSPAPSTSPARAASPAASPAPTSVNPFAGTPGFS